MGNFEWQNQSYNDKILKVNHNKVGNLSDETFVAEVTLPTQSHVLTPPPATNHTSSEVFLGVKWVEEEMSSPIGGEL